MINNIQLDKYKSSSSNTKEFKSTLLKKLNHSITQIYNTHNQEINLLKSNIESTIKDEASRQTAILNIAKDFEDKKIQLENEMLLRLTFEKEKDQLLLQLKEKSGSLEAIVDFMNEGLVVSDLSGVFLIFNPSAEEIMGVSPTKVGKNHWGHSFKLFKEDGTELTKDCDPIQLAIKEKNYKNQIILCKNEKYPQGILLNFNSNPIYNKDGKHFAAMATFRDISQEREQQVKMESLNSDLLRSNQDLDQFAYVASHDLRSPLRAIKQLSAWILEDENNKLTTESKENFELLQSRTQRLDSLLDALLKYSRAGRASQEISTVDVKNIVNNIFDGLHNPNNIKILTSQLPSFKTKKTPFYVVMQNLIDNAIKHNDHEKGVITISCSDKGHFYQFNIQDNGPGIEEKYYDKVFQIFKTLQARDKKEGSGMGLSIVKKIIENQGGEIWLQQPDKKPGVIFSFTWPKTL